MKTAHALLCLIFLCGSLSLIGQAQEVSCDTLQLQTLQTKLDSLYAAGSLKKALEITRDMTPLTQACYGEESPEMVENLHNIGYLFLEMRQFQPSAEAYAEAISRAREVFSPNDTLYMWYLKFYAQALRRNGDYREALPVHREIYDYTLQYDKDDPKRVASWANTLGLVHKKLGHFEDARELYQTALQVTEKHFGKKAPQYGIYQNNLAGLHRSRGQYEEALRLYQGALENARLNYGEKSRKYSLRQRNLAGLYSSMGLYEKALPMAVDGLTLAKELHGKISYEYSRALNTLGVLYQRMGLYTESIALMEESKEITLQTLGRDHPEYSIAVNNLALSYKLSGKLDLAENMYRESIELAAASMGKTSRSYASQLDNLSQVYFKKEQYDSAIALSKQSLEITRQNGGEHTHNYAIQTNNLALSYSELEVYDTAKILFEQALNIQRDLLGNQHPEIAIRLNNLGKLYERQDSLERAASYYCSMIENVIGQLANYYPAMGELQRLNFLANLEPFTSTMYSFSVKKANDPRVAKTVQELSLASKGLALESSIASRIKAQSSQNDELSRLQDAWSDTRIVLYKAYAMRADQRASIGLDLDSLKQYVQELEGKISRLAGVDISTEQFAWEKWKENIPAGTAAIDFFRYEENKAFQKTGVHWYAAMINKPGQDHPVIVPLLSEEELKKHLTDNPNNPASYLHPDGAGVLGKKLMAPLLPHLDKMDHLILVPAGLLHKVAFDILRLPGQENRLLIDRFAIQYYNNLRDLGRKKPVAKSDDFLLAGGAVFDMDSTELVQLLKHKEMLPEADELIAFASRSHVTNSLRSGLYFPPLPGTEKEVRQIAGILQKAGKKVEVLTGAAALEDAIKAHSGEKAPGVLHLATHGYFFEQPESRLEGLDDIRSKFMLSENPLFRSGLVFSGVHHVWQGGRPIEGLEDGILTAYEIANLDLRQTKLVVLSACETGLGSIHQAEGVLGLQRAFQSAGADKLILSLWKVPDRETAELMELFYRYYLKSDDVSGAFRKARREMRKKYDPFYWAGFVLIE